MTGMSGTGKSTALVELARRGFRVVDTDEPGWNVWRDGERVWREDRMSELLAIDAPRTLFARAVCRTRGASTTGSTRSCS